MSQMEIDNVLAQIRAISAQTKGGVGSAVNPLGGASAAGVSGPSFAQVLKGGIEQATASQQRAGQLSDAFEKGTPGVELPQVMLEIQKATVSFRALTEVRNRFVSAYQEIMSMSI
jgi:flagellar hook-basal body complex protein FliE